MMTRLNVLCLVLACLGGAAQGATWYLDKDARGAGTGASWPDAWATPAQIGRNLKPGDTLYISGGAHEKIYSGGWIIANGGTAGAPIRIAVDSGNPMHNGKVIFDWAHAGEEANTNGFVLKGYVTFDGGVNGAQHIVFRNLVNYLNKGVGIVLRGSGTWGVEVRYCRFENVNGGISISNCSGIVIENSSFVGIRGDAAISLGSHGSWDANHIRHCDIEVLTNGVSPPGRTSYNGPDGIQATDGLSAYNNTFRVSPTTVYTSPQHPDMLQVNGRCLKVYNNEFINIGDSGISPSPWFADQPIGDIWIFNNVFRNEQVMGKYPEFIRMYNNKGLPFFYNVKILNNTFLDATNGNTNFIKFGQEEGNPPGSGNEIKNNMFYNVGAGNSYVISLPISKAGPTGQSHWEFDGNTYFHPNPVYSRLIVAGAIYKAADWVAAKEPNGSTTDPRLVRYSPWARNNDLRLLPRTSDKGPRGVDLSHLCSEMPALSFDKAGNMRTPGSWGVGAYGLTREVSRPTGFRVLPLK